MLSAKKIAHASRTTHHASRTTHHASRITQQRITHHAATHHASRITQQRITHHACIHAKFSCTHHAQTHVRARMHPLTLTAARLISIPVSKALESEFSAPAITITMSPPFVGILKMRGDARQRAVQHALASRLHAMEAAAAAAAAMTQQRRRRQLRQRQLS